MKEIKTLLIACLVFASIFYALTTGNGIEPSDLIPKLKSDVQLFTGDSHQPLLPQPPIS